MTATIPLTGVTLASGSLERIDVVRAAHNVSKHGLEVSLTEMTVKDGVGFRADLSKPAVKGGGPRRGELLFTEGRSQVVVEVARGRLTEA